MVTGGKLARPRNAVVVYDKTNTRTRKNKNKIVWEGNAIKLHLLLSLSLSLFRSDIENFHALLRRVAVPFPLDPRSVVDRKETR